MKYYRLRKNVEFRRVYRRGKSFATDILVLYIFKNYRNFIDGNEINRAGISVSKKVGKSVIRSRVKRLISEGYRLNSANINKKYDLVFVARSAAKDKSYWEIESSIKKLLKKAGLYKDEKNSNNTN